MSRYETNERDFKKFLYNIRVKSLYVFRRVSRAAVNHRTSQGKSTTYVKNNVVAGHMYLRRRR